MKKTFILLLATVMFASCDLTPDLESRVVDITVIASDWIYVSAQGGLSGYYYCDIEMPEINSSVFYDGVINSYVVFDGGVQQELPYVQHNQNSFGERWSRTTDCQYNAGGYMTFFVTDSEYYGQSSPPTMKFRVTMIW